MALEVVDSMLPYFW